MEAGDRGAQTADVRWTVLREGAMLAGAGAVVGLGAALAGARVLSNMVYGVTATDLVTYAGSVALLMVVMLAACYLTARRACRVDPMAALRAE